MLLRSGDIDPPWGTPVMLATETPSSSTPAFSHIRISRSTLRSLTRRATNLKRKSWSRLPKKSAKSASTTHRAPAFTSLRMTSNAWKAARLGLNPNEHGRKLASKIGSSTSLAAVCTTRSRTEGFDCLQRFAVDAGGALVAADLFPGPLQHIRPSYPVVEDMEPPLA